MLPNYPVLVGQNSAYLVQQMKDIKSGARANAQSVVMKPFTVALSEAEIKQLVDFWADYLAVQK